jgi:phosphatidylinositol glycan class M
MQGVGKMEACATYGAASQRCPLLDGPLLDDAPRCAAAGRLVAAALLFGLAVHWRLYPLIFALPLLRHFALQRQRKQAAAKQRQRPNSSRPGGAGLAARLAAAAGSLVSPRGVAFGALSGFLFLGLAALFYWLYGPLFLHETYLYHASRTDPRHNFSPYFYPAYLASGSGGSGAGGSGGVGDGSGGGWEIGW